MISTALEDSDNDIGLISLMLDNESHYPKKDQHSK